MKHGNVNIFIHTEILNNELNTILYSCRQKTKHTSSIYGINLNKEQAIRICEDYKIRNPEQNQLKIKPSNIPDYTNNLNAAYKIVEAMIKLDTSWTSLVNNNNIQSTFYYQSTKFTSVSKSLPQAISLSAIKMFKYIKSLSR
jgi:hypothetical protein